MSTGSSRFRGRAVGLVLAAVSFLAPGPGLAVAAPVRGWSSGPAALLAGRGLFNGVAALSARDAWAVGCASTCNLIRPASLIVRWDGSSWRRIRHPGITGELDGVAVTSDRNAWAVGDRGPRPDSFIVRWNGTRWALQPSPRPAGGSRLYGVAAASAMSAWAVGCASCGDRQRTLIVHWDGSHWKRVPSPSPPGAALYAVTAAPRGVAWAVGTFPGIGRQEPLILRWTGRTWQRTSVPSVSRGILDGVAVSGQGVWAVGCTGCFRPDQNALILRWDGRSWTRTPAPVRGDLYAVTAGPRHIAWAAGVAGTGYRFHPRPLILRWSGHAWTREPCPAPPAGTSIYALAATSGRNAWAVGETASFFNPHPRPVALHWNGKTWR